MSPIARIAQLYKMQILYNCGKENTRETPREPNAQEEFLFYRGILAHRPYRYVRRIYRTLCVKFMISNRDNVRSVLGDPIVRRQLLIDKKQNP